MASRFNHACALSNEGALYCWGENFEGEIGQEDAFPGDQNPTAADALSALRVAGEWTEVDTGQGHTCAIASEGSLWCWGRNTGSELGGGTEIQVRAPQRVDDALDWAELTSGQASNLALKDDGSLWGWGNNVGYGNGEGAPLGVPTEGVPTPTRVGDQIGWLAPSTRIFHSCALRSDELWCWGRNIEGQLGLGDHELRTEPALVGSGYIEVSAAGFGTCAVSNTGVVACTGKNDVGELGTGDAVRRAEFTAVRGFAR
jgi:alpha-tubulin suppressor-like RCC1 family protein